MATVTTYNVNHNFSLASDSIILNPGLSGCNSFSITFAYTANSNVTIEYYWSNDSSASSVLVPLTDANGTQITTELLAANTTAGIQITNFFGERLFIKVVKKSATTGNISSVIIKTY